MPDTRRWVQQSMRWYLFRPMIEKCVHGCQESSARSTGAWRTTVTRNSGRTSVQMPRLILLVLSDEELFRLLDKLFLPDTDLVETNMVGS